MQESSRHSDTDGETHTRADASTAAGHASTIEVRKTGRPQPPDHENVFAMALSPPVYRLARLGFYSLQAVCALYCVAAGALLHCVRKTTTAYYPVLQRDLPRTKYTLIASSHYVVGSLHCCFLLEPVVRSFVKRAMQTAAPFATASGRDAATRWHHFVQHLASGRLVPLVGGLSFMYTQLFTQRGVFGVQHPHYEVVLLLREVLELTLQSYQAYQLSRLLSRPNFNRFFVATLVSNAWATPVLHYTVVNTPLQRLLCRLSDVCLDFVSSVGVVPVIIVLSYLDDVDWSTCEVLYERALVRRPVVRPRHERSAARVLQLMGRRRQPHGVQHRLGVVSPQHPRAHTRGKATETQLHPPGHAPCSPFRCEASSTASLRSGAWTGSSSAVSLRTRRFDRPPPRRAPRESATCVSDGSASVARGAACLLTRRAQLPAISPIPPATLKRLQPFLDHWTPRRSLTSCSGTALASRFCQRSRRSAVSSASDVQLVNRSMGRRRCPLRSGPQPHEDRVLPSYQLLLPHPPIRPVVTDVPTSTAGRQVLGHQSPLDPSGSPRQVATGVALCMEFSELEEFPSALTKTAFYLLMLVGNRIRSVPAQAINQGPRILSLSGSPIEALPEDGWRVDNWRSWNST